MSNDQQLALDWIAAELEQGGTNPVIMPFKLSKFRSVRGALVGAGLVVKTGDGRYVPTAQCNTYPGQAARPRNNNRDKP